MINIDGLSYCKESLMPKSPSGRIVIQIPVDLKKQLYAKLALSGKNLKEWFVSQATDWIKETDKDEKKADK